MRHEEEEFYTLSEMNKALKELKKKDDLESKIEAHVNSKMIKYVWQNWQTVLIIIGIISLNLILTLHFFRSDFKRLEQKIAIHEDKKDRKPDSLNALSRGLASSGGEL